MTGPTEVLAEFTVKTSFDDLPPSVVERTKQILVDSIGCALGSYVTDKAEIVLDFVDELGGKAQASIIGNKRTSATLAAFANGELINALDYDALGPFMTHVVPYVLPPCLAIGEQVGASGKDLITAMAIASEVGGRVFSSLSQHRALKKEPPYWETSDRFSNSSTVFGGVAGACKLLGLDREEVANAFGIAGASTSVPAQQKWNYTGGAQIMTKYNCWAGWIAQLATVAALLAAKSFTGDTTILDGEWGFWKIVGSPFFKDDTLIGGLGEVWHLDTVSFKRYPCCGSNQAGIDAINKIIQENDIKPENIESITVQGDPQLLRPCRLETEIKSFVDAQFSNAYLFALAPYYGREPSPAWQTPAIMQDSRIRSLMEKVKVEEHPNTSENILRMLNRGESALFFDVAVEVTVGSKKFRAEIKDPKGSPGNPMSDEELKGKFRNNASYSNLPSSTTEKIVEMVYKLDRIDNISKLMKLLTTSFPYQTEHRRIAKVK